MSRLPGGMASPFINFLFCFAKGFDSQRGYEKKAVLMTAFLFPTNITNYNLCFYRITVEYVPSGVSVRPQTSAFSST